MNLPTRDDSSNNGGMSFQARSGHPDASLTQLNDGALNAGFFHPAN
jgi:hypothetical protein